MRARGWTAQNENGPHRRLRGEGLEWNRSSDCRLEFIKKTEIGMAYSVDPCRIVAISAVACGRALDQYRAPAERTSDITRGCCQATEQSLGYHLKFSQGEHTNGAYSTLSARHYWSHVRTPCSYIARYVPLLLRLLYQLQEICRPLASQYILASSTRVSLKQQQTASTG